MGYLKLLASESDKITFHEMGRTAENRSVNYVIISSAENHQNLDEIREANFELANNPGDATVSNQPIIVWMS